MCNTKNISDFITKLQEIVNQPNDSLEKAVTIEALNRDTPNFICHFFEDLLKYGCVSGMVSSLVYYADTNAFFDKYYHEIINLKEDYEEAIGQPMKIPYQLKNYLAWFAFEETARRLWESR